MKSKPSPFINRKKKTIVFHMVNPCATHITVAGSFNQWARNQIEMKPDSEGEWIAEIPLLPHGKYLYKFFIDDRMATEDIENPYREPDGVNGWNSLLMV